MEKIWTELYNAAKAVQNPREISERIEAGGVAAAIEAASGRIYTGVCVDTRLHPWDLCGAQCHVSHDY
ncbi:hypothetical protein SAMN02910358_01415 [Lachnospiraceae bacterium XBB1006]|nr:hypothetical protein SAMN02910358_01415 [Lachnospiraceae bacterium XBB1006]